MQVYPLLLTEMELELEEKEHKAVREVEENMFYINIINS